MFTLESPHRGDSNEYTQYTIFQYEKENHTKNYPNAAAMGFFSKGLKNVFESGVINEPSVFEPLKFYCISYIMTHELTSIITYNNYIIKTTRCIAMNKCKTIILAYNRQMKHKAVLNKAVCFSCGLQAEAKQFSVLAETAYR